MPTRLNAPVLKMDAGQIHKVDPKNVEALFGMWTIFSKCSESLEGGKRYENLSWRIWNRETFCCSPKTRITPAIDSSLPAPSEKNVPRLSSSVESRLSDKSSSTGRTEDDQEEPELSRSYGLRDEPHLTAFGLTKMVLDIQENADVCALSESIQASLPPLLTPLHTIDSKPTRQAPPPEVVPQVTLNQLQNSTDSCYSATTANSDITQRQSDHRGSDTSVSSDGLIRSGSVVHGFSPSQIPSSMKVRAKSGLTQPLRASPRPTAKLMPKKENVFTLGGSSGEDESSYEDRMSFKPQKARFTAQRSSLSESIKLSAVCLKKPLEEQRQVSFRDIVQARQEEMKATNSYQDEDAIETSEDEDELISDSAIDEDEDGDWEEFSEDGKADTKDEPVFKRVDSRPNLVSRRSMLTTALHEPERAQALANAASRSTPILRRSRTSSPTGPSLPASPTDNDEETGLTMRALPSSSRPRPITVPAHNSSSQPPLHSPRTTRRNMLSTELTESLRKNLLWERQQKNTTFNAADAFQLKRGVKSMANLQQPPSTSSRIHKLSVGDTTSKNNSWNDMIDTATEYHYRGW